MRAKSATVLHRTQSGTRGARRGGTYVIVLGSALIVSTLGMTAILQQRIQRRGFEATADREQARLHIESALRLGLLMIQRDQDWRTTYAASDGEVLTELSTEYGSFTLRAIDPLDDDLTDDEHDPVVLQATATAGDAEQLGELTLYPTTVPPDVLWKGIIAGGNVTASGSTVRSERPVSCAASTLTSANLYADVEAATINGSTYHGEQTLVSDTSRPALPDIDAIISEYTSRGTVINISSLPTSTPNLLRNSGMEQGQNGGPADYWYSPPNPPESATCMVEQSGDQYYSGDRSLLVKNRSDWSAGPVQYCTEWVKPNRTYEVSAYIYYDPEFLNPTEFRFNWYTNGTSSPANWQSGGLLQWGGKPVWERLHTTMLAGSWSGDMVSSYLKIETDSGNHDFYVDDVTVHEINRSFLHRQVLSPNSNPFGSANPDGIYVIDCSGSSICIERCRIQGTLVILNPGPNSAVEGPISWEPARPGYPALIVGSSSSLYAAHMRIAHTRLGLSEALNGTNFNPSGTPHDAVGTDSDQNDTLPSEIRGWIYVGGTLTFRDAPTVHGVVMAGEDIDFGGTPIIHWNAEPIYHSPPGLEGTLELKRREGAFKRTVR